MRLRFIILALLHARGPNTGYGLSRTLQNELSYVWRATLQQIYFEVARMHEEGLVDRKIGDGKRNAPRLKIYSITDAGEAELMRWIRDKPLSSHKDELPAHLICSSLLGPTALTEQIEERLEQREREAVRLCALISTDGRDAGVHLAMDLQLRRIRSEMEWCHEALATLRGSEAGVRSSI
jgi:PadR family transcriptional regulator AphA